jgi:cell wall-associated NlpC family hydrolase
MVRGYKRRHNMLFKLRQRIHYRSRICAALLVFVLAGSLAAGACEVQVVSAKTAAEKKRDAAKKKLQETNEDIEDIKDNQESVASDLTEASTQLKNLLVKQDALKVDIKNKQAQVEDANEQLEEAQRVEEEQYEAMKLRIQYMYENSTENSIWMAILQSDGIADMINRIEYATELNQTDRDLMDSYEEATQQVLDWTNQLADEMEELLDLQDQYSSQQSELNTLIAKLEKEKETYAKQLADAKSQAAEYQETITEQEAIIRAQEAAAAQQAASTYEGGGSGASGGIGSDSYLQDETVNPSNATSVSGEAVVSYALQFVGNPYKWGGNSLTDGVDCSGFVHQVYAHFGISTPRYSQAFKSVGQAVAYQNIKAGDVVVYPGHVAIYIGNGNIVEAQSTRAGITSNRSVNCHTITAIRRLV